MTPYTRHHSVFSLLHLMFSLFFYSSPTSRISTNLNTLSLHDALPVSAMMLEAGVSSPVIQSAAQPPVMLQQQVIMQPGGQPAVAQPLGAIQPMVQPRIIYQASTANTVGEYSSRAVLGSVDLAQEVCLWNKDHFVCSMFMLTAALLLTGIRIRLYRTEQWLLPRLYSNTKIHTPVLPHMYSTWASIPEFYHTYTVT